MGLVQGKVALVFGGGSGIGLATAKLLAAEGARVAVADLDRASAAEAAALIGPAGEARALTVDVTDRRQVEEAVAAVVGRFGALDCAVNSAGVALAGAPMADMTDDHWRRNIDVNLTGTLNCVRAEAAQMRGSGGGSIVNIASGAGLKGSPTRAAYVAAKHGVVGLTKSAAIDHAREGVRVNAICPGLILTPMTRANVEGGRLDPAALCPMARVGEPEEVAQAVVWLCSDRSSFVTGVPLPVDGGYAAW